MRSACAGLRPLAPLPPRRQRDGLVDVEGLWQVLEGTALVRGDRGVEVAVRGHHDDRQVRMPAAQRGQQAEAAGAGHADVGDQYVGFMSLQRRERRLGGVEGARLHAALLQRSLEHPADGGIVVHEPDVERLGHLRFSMGSRTVKTVRPGRLSNSIRPS